MYKNRIKKAILAGTLLLAPYIQTVMTTIEPIYAQEEEKNQTVIWGTLKQAGYSDTAVASLLANLEAESLCNPLYIQGGRTMEQFVQGAVGVGIGQWTSATKQDELFEFAKEKEADWQELNVQVEFLLKDLEETTWLDERYKSFDEFKNTDDLDKATKMVMQGYFKPTDQSQSAVDTRLKLAKEFLTTYGVKTEIEPKNEEVEPKKETPQQQETKIEQKTEEKSEKSVATYSPITESVSEKITTTMNTATGETGAGYSNMVSPMATFEGTGEVYPVIPVSIVGVAFVVALGYAVLDRTGTIDKVEDGLVLYNYRRQRSKSHK